MSCSRTQRSDACEARTPSSVKHSTTEPLYSPEEMLLKDIYLEIWQPLCSVERTISAILLEGIMRYNSVKLI